MKRSGAPKSITFPVIVQRGPTGKKAVVKILSTPTCVKGKRYDSYTVVYYSEGKRHRERFNDYSKALAQAEEAATKLSNEANTGLHLAGEDLRIYSAALDSLNKQEVSLENAVAEYCEAAKILKGVPILKAALFFQQHDGAPIELALREHADAKKILGGVSLIEAANFYDRHGRSVVKKGTLEEIRRAMLAALEADGCSKYHIRDLKRHLKAFVEKFPVPIEQISTSQINEWLRELPVGDRTRDNFRDSVHNFFNYARTEGYLPKDRPTAAHDTKRINAAGAENQVFTVEEAHAMLCGAPDWLIPCLAMKLFCGIRTEEMLRIEWDCVKFDQDVLILSKQVTKTKQRRIVPILPNLKLWLLPYSDATGRIADRWSSAQTLSKSWTNRAKNVGITYKKNAMRNSYISYRVAAIKNIAQVSLESGNSPVVIQKDYLELVTETDAKRWFSLVPGGGLPE